MRRYTLIITALCVMLPGCGPPWLWRTSSYESQESQTRQASNVAYGVEGQPIEELTFEEEASDLHATAEDDHVELVEEPTQDNDIRARQLEQARYGFKPIYFDFDQYRIREDQQDALESNLKAVSRIARKGKKGKTVVIEGHACRFAGSPEYNMQLSEKRAQAVKDYLVEHGVPESKLKVVGRGHTMCLVPSGNKEQQAPNRRVEFHVLEQ